MAKVLVVDDNVDMLDTLEHLFMFYEFEVVRAENGREALEVAETEQPGIIILDALMPIMNGFDACEKLKNNARTKNIPVIFLSANYTEEEHRLKGLELGADDYMMKPFNAKELIAKVNALLHRKQLIDNLRHDNLAFIKQRHRPHHDSEEIASRRVELDGNQIIDELTGLYNLGFFEERLEREMIWLREKDAPGSIMLIDVDFFQKINEIFGEYTGDYVLLKIANVILHHSRDVDMVFRLGKNKFGVILPQTEESRAFYQAEQIRTAIHQTRFFHEDFFELKRLSPKRKYGMKNITASIGITSMEGVEGINELFKQAEKALTRAKAKGRNVTLRFSEME